MTEKVCRPARGSAQASKEVARLGVARTGEVGQVQTWHWEQRSAAEDCEPGRQSRGAS